MSKRNASLWPVAPPRIHLAKPLLGGKYELVRLIGQGSMGEVWQASHVTLHQQFAIKLLAASVDGIPIESADVASARFRFEAQIAARLSRKTRHIVRVTDHGEEEGIAYLVMELLEGRTLESSLMQSGCMAPAQVSALVAQIARGLAHAHADGVVHRDLKPGNVFLTRDEDDRLVVKLLDFGIARAIRPHPTRAFHTARGVVFGTPGYMSPEQTDASVDLDRHCDLWALATIAYEALSGDLPLEGVDPAELLYNVRSRRLVPLRERCPELPSTLDAFFERAFAAHARDRFDNAPELALAFESALAGADGAGSGPSVPLGPTQAVPPRSAPIAPSIPTRVTPYGPTTAAPSTVDNDAHRRPGEKRPWHSPVFILAAVVASIFATLVGANSFGFHLGPRGHDEPRATAAVSIPGEIRSPGETQSANGSAPGPAVLGGVGPAGSASSEPPAVAPSGVGAAPAPRAVPADSPHALPLPSPRRSVPTSASARTISLFVAPAPALSPSAASAPAVSPPAISPSLGSAPAISPPAARAPAASPAMAPRAPAPAKGPADRSDVL